MIMVILKTSIHKMLEKTMIIVSEVRETSRVHVENADSQGSVFHRMLADDL